LLLRREFDLAILSLVSDGVVSKREGRNEFRLALASPITDYDDDHPLFKLCWDQLGIGQEGSEIGKDSEPGGEIKEMVSNYFGDKEHSDYKQMADLMRHMAGRVSSMSSVVDKQLRDEVSAEAGDKSEPKTKDKPSFMKDILKKIYETKGTEDFDELPEDLRRQVAFGIVYRTEVDLRKFVEDVLNVDTNNANWWKDRVPEDIRKAVHDRIQRKKEKRAKADVKLEGVTRLLNDTDLSQLIQIINYGKNIQAFEKAFMDKGLKNVNPFLTLVAERRSTCDIMHPDKTITIDKEFVVTLDELCMYVKKQMETYYMDATVSDTSPT
jgi:hypothetical protein